MKAIVHRLRRLEVAAAPPERERKIAEAIREARRRLWADDEPVRIPPEVYAGCRTLFDRIRRARQFLVEQRTTHPQRAIVGVEPAESAPIM